MPIVISNSSHRSCKMEALVESCPPICSLIYSRENGRHLTPCVLWHHWLGPTRHPPARKETTYSRGRGFLCRHILCRELLSCVRALLAKLLNIKGNVVAKTWIRVWMGQQLRSTRSPSAISLHTMNFSPAGFPFDRENPVLVSGQGWALAL